MNTFGSIVKHFMVDYGITQREIADKIGCNPNTISQLLSRDNISLDKMLLITDALNCDLKITLEPRTNKPLDKSDKP